MSYTLRDLPLPVKVVASVFLMAVGVGYSSAMMQLHMQDSKSGELSPSMADVIRKFTGKVKFDPAKPLPGPACTFVKLVSAPRTASWGGNGTMSPAFFNKDGGDWDKIDPADLPGIEKEREGEQKVAILWAEAAPDTRKTAYEQDKFVPSAGKEPEAITPRFKNPDGSFKVKSIIDTRCVRCHKQGKPQEGFPLETYAQLEEKYLNVPGRGIPQAGDWVKVEEPISIEKLTQSTHAHLLSWAVLFSLTGVIFAFSSYRTFVRCILGPWVVIAVFADVALWWAARLNDNEWGPKFAMAIIGTGALAGLGLGAQIVLSLLNMYGRKGKIVILALFLLGGGIAGTLFVTTIKPALDKKQNDLKNPPPKKDDPNGKKVNGNGKIDPKTDVKFPLPALSKFEKLVAYPLKDDKGQPLPFDHVDFDGAAEGSMARAFFDKEKHFEKTMDDANVPQAEKDKLMSEREGEIRALVAWLRSEDKDRKAAYDANAFPLPADLGKPVTTQFLKDGKLQVKTLIGVRCATCHNPDKKGSAAKDYPLTNYDELKDYLKPLK